MATPTYLFYSLWLLAYSSSATFVAAAATGAAAAVAAAAAAANKATKQQQQQQQQRDKNTRPPNVILILAEDMGFGDLACYGHPYARTPNLDRLAAEGTRFTRFYVSGATCNPSRSGIMSSRNPPTIPNCK